MPDVTIKGRKGIVERHNEDAWRIVSGHEVLHRDLDWHHWSRCGWAEFGSMEEAEQFLREHADHSAASPDCRCRRCLDDDWEPGVDEHPIPPSRRYMVVCQTCGNKRCPHAEWHGYRCTGSNEPEQVPQPAVTINHPLADLIFSKCGLTQQQAVRVAEVLLGEGVTLPSEPAEGRERTWPAWLDEVYELIHREKENAVANQDFDRAVHWRDVYYELRAAVVGHKAASGDELTALRSRLKDSNAMLNSAAKWIAAAEAMGRAAGYEHAESEISPEYFAEKVVELITALREQVTRLEQERDDARKRLLTAAGDDLCRLSQEEIKSMTAGTVKIPPKDEFLASCERFHAQIASESGVNHNCLTLAQLIAENEKQRQQLTARDEEVRRLQQQRDILDGAVADMGGELDAASEHFDDAGNIKGNGEWRLREIAACFAKAQEIERKAVADLDKLDASPPPPPGSRERN